MRRNAWIDFLIRINYIRLNWLCRTLYKNFFPWLFGNHSFWLYHYFVRRKELNVPNSNDEISKDLKSNYSPNKKLMFQSLWIFFLKERKMVENPSQWLKYVVQLAINSNHESSTKKSHFKIFLGIKRRNNSNPEIVQTW